MDEFPEYWSSEKIALEKASRGNVFQGTIHFLKQQKDDAVVETENGHRIKITGALQLNRTFDGDVVVVQASANKKNQWNGTVVSVIESSGCRRLVGIIHRDGVLTPSKVHQPFVKVPANLCAADSSLCIGVVVGAWPTHLKIPEATSALVLGPVNRNETCRSKSLFLCGLPQPEFSDEVLSAAQALGVITNEDRASRLDLTEYRCVCIDGCSTDIIDDAIHVRQVDAENIEVGVHLTDVAHFITASSMIYQDAVQRVQNGYFGQNLRTTMLPPVLATDRLSLHEGKERLALSFLFTMGLNADIKHINVVPTIICVQQCLSYDQAQGIIDRHLTKPQDDSSDNESQLNEQLIAEQLVELLRLSKILASNRQQQGSLSNPPGLLVINDPECDGDFIAMPENCETHYIIEQFSLLTNIHAAQLLLECAPCGIVRRQVQPDDSAFTILRNIAANRRLTLDFSSLSALYQSIEATYAETEDPLFTTALHQLVNDTAISSAQYCSSNEPDLTHYSMNVPAYCHFTSPLRRIADLTCLQLLKSSLGHDMLSAADSRSANDIKILCKHINGRTKALNSAVVKTKKLVSELENMTRFADQREQALAEGSSDMQGPQEVAFVTSISTGKIRVTLPKVDSRTSLTIPNGARLEDGKVRLNKVLISIGQRLIVQMNTDHKGKLKPKLVFPIIKGFSVRPRAGFDDETKNIQPDHKDPGTSAAAKKPRLR